MHWKVQDALMRHGPGVTMLLSLGLIGALATAGLSPRVPGYAEVAPVRIASLEAGVVKSVHSTPGQLVSAGEVLAVLDDSRIEGRMRVLRAELDRQSAAVVGVTRDAEAQVKSISAEKEVVDSRLTAARAALAVAERRLADRQRQVTAGLTAADSLLPLEADVATQRGAVQSLEAQRRSRRDALEYARAGVGGDDAQVAMEEARAVGVIREELALLEERRGSMTLRAPLDARVGSVNFRVGEILPEQVALAELLPLATTTVVACLPEQLSVVVRPGVRVDLRPATGGESRGGTVVDVAGLVSEAPERCKQRSNEIGWVRPVRIQVDGGELVPGQRFDVAFSPSEDPNG